MLLSWRGGDKMVTQTSYSISSHLSLTLQNGISHECKYVLRSSFPITTFRLIRKKKNREPDMLVAQAIAAYLEFSPVIIIIIFKFSNITNEN